MRRLQNQIITLCAVFCCVSVGSADVITSPMFARWGDDLLMQMESDFGRWDGLYYHSLTDRFADYAWGQGVMSNALTAAARVDPGTWLQRAIDQADEFHDRYWCTQNGTSGYNAGYGGCGDRYYDDNAWIALALAELYELTGNEKYLTWARETVAFSMSGENGPGDTPDGGIRWHESNTGGASICSTAPTCLANLMIYQLSGIESYRIDGLRLMEWLLNASDFRYSSGIFHETNQGPLGYQTAVVTQAAVRAYRITGDAGYLAEAQRMARAMEDQFINGSSHALKSTGKWGGHDMTNAYADLYEVDHDPYWLSVAIGYLVFLHDNCMDPDSGLYPTSWDNTSGDASGGLIDNASAVRAFWRMAATPGGITPIDDYLVIRNPYSGRCLRPLNSVTADNNKTVLYDEVSSWTSNRWTVRDLGNGYFTLRHWIAEKPLQPTGNQTADDTTAVIYPDNPLSFGQQWAFIETGNGYFNIQNRLTGKSLQPFNDGTANNTDVVLQATDLSKQSQQWTFSGDYIPTSVIPHLLVDGDWRQTDQVTANAGDTITLKAAASGAGSYYWEGPDGFTATTPQITLSNVRPDQSGCYTAVFVNTKGTESFCAVRVTVHSAITLYQHCPYAGWTARFGVGAYTAADIVAAGGRNNDASSFIIQPGYTVRFYDGDNFTGASLVKNADVDCLVDDGWNDRLSSMIIEEQPLHGHWTFNETAGLTAADASGNGRSGLLVNMDADARTLGKQCGGLAFDGMDDYVAINNFTGIGGGSSRTCMAWIKTDDRQVANILSWGSPANGQKWMFRLGSLGSLEVGIWGGYIQDDTPLDDGRWHHVAAVLDNDGTPAVGDIRLYVDGQRQLHPYANSTQAIVTAGEAPVYIGTRLDDGTLHQPFSGLLDEVRIYGRALSDAEISAIYRAQVLAGDVEPDGDVDLLDFAALADAWGDTQTCDRDLTCDCIVDFDDLMVLIDEWLMVE